MMQFTVHQHLLCIILQMMGRRNRSGALQGRGVARSRVISKRCFFPPLPGPRWC